MSKYERVIRIGEIDTETGVFPATLATEGEASDGHILSIKGGRIPARMPLLPSHWNDPTVVLGSLTNPQKALGEKPPRLRMTGQIEMDGKGLPLELRQDLTHMIAKGHVTGMSIRWDEIEGHPPVRRVNLPSDHPAFIDDSKEKSWRKRMGLYFEHWQGMEGSIVALGSDKEALIGRADETTGQVSTFWRAMAENTEELTDSERDRLIAEDAGKYTPEEHAAASLAALRMQVNDCREAGADPNEMCEAFVGSLAEAEAESIRVVLRKEDADAEDQLRNDYEQLRELLERLEAAEQRAIAAEAALEEAQKDPDQDPAPPARKDPETSLLTLDAKDIRQPIDVQALAPVLQKLLDDADERRSRLVQKMLDLATGKVS